ncbi:MAG: hypothetical protein ABSH38_17285 [Verrucomicrobiota bacterium]|jgi:hypothetical protein
MSKPIILLLAGAVFCLPGRGAVPPPEKLLPKDTVLVVTAPDWGKAWTFLTNTPYGRLWQDPAVKPFKDKFMEKFTAEVLTPVEQNFKIKLSDYQGLAQGQVTFAIVPAGQQDNPEFHFAQILLVDTKDHAGQLKTNLAAIEKKWADAGRPMKTQKLRDLEFTTLIASPDDLSWNKIFQKAKPADAAEEGAAKPAEKKVELTIGQSDSLVLIGDSTEVIEKVLSRQAGGLVAPLEEQADFQADYGARLRASPIYAWVNAQALLDVLAKPPPGAADASADNSLKFNALAGALGLRDLTSASFSYQNLPGGLAAQLFVRAPEGQRRGLLKVFAPDPKEAKPPPFVPADAVKFWRWRLNIPHSWALLETMLNELNPPIVATVNSLLQMAGKDKDEHYDLKAELLANLGDDIISYEKAPKGGTLEDLKSAPSLVLIGSPDAEKLAAAVKVGLGVPARGSGGIKDREFLGRTIYSMSSQAPGKGAPQSFNFCGSGGYLALSSDTDILEEYLRSNDSKAKALADTAGLPDAAQRTGGMATGWFGFENQNQSMRPVFDILRKQPLTLSEILGTPQALGGLNPGDQAAKLREWADFSLLPSFDAVSKYFYFSVYAGSFSPEGFTLKIFAPTPPQLR